MKSLGWVCLLFAGSAYSADWQLLGASEIGAYYADRQSLKWQGTDPIFSIATNVVEKDKTEWNTVIQIDCGNNAFTYLKGAKLEGGKTSLRFDTPRSTEKILSGTMPHMLRTEYCGAMPVGNNKIVRWEPAGKSNVANVYFDRSSLQQDSNGFTIDTKVVPFDHEEETYGTVSFSCTDKTFTMLKLDRFKNGRLEKVFDTPQQTLPTSKTATLAIVANEFCSDAKSVSSSPKVDVCTQAVATMRNLETRIQKDVNNAGLQCAQVDDHLKQIESVAEITRDHDCGISGLEAYKQQIKTVTCIK